MGIVLFVMAGLQLVAMLIVIAGVGKPRDPVTPSLAAWISLVSLIYMAILVFAGIMLL